MLKKFLFLVLFLSVSIYHLPLVLATTVPSSLSIQGRLTDSKNVNREGNLAFVFTVYDALTGGAILWKKTYANVQVRGGTFHVLLGSPDGKDDTNRNIADIFDGSDRWVGIQVESQNGTLEPEMIPRQKLASVAYAFVANRLTLPTVPIGTILDWYRPTPTTAMPEGYQMCDGSLITDPESPMQGQNTPNLIDKITYGVTLARVDQREKKEGNTINLNHVHSMAHTHTMDFKTTLRDGISGRANIVRGLGRDQMSGEDGRLVFNLMWEPSEVQFSLFAPYVVGTTQGSSSGNTGDSPSLGAVDIRPAYIGVVKILRIK